MDCLLANVGDKLVVGQVDTSFLSIGAKLLPGTAVLNGPVIIGANGGVGIDRAACMIGPPLKPAIPASLEVIGITNIIGNLNVPALSNFTGAITIVAATVGTGALSWNGVQLFAGAAARTGAKADAGARAEASVAAQGSTLNIAGAASVGGVVTTIDVETPFCSLNGTFAIATKALGLAGKGFDIPHPTKKEHRLRYICLEGPEVGAYIRGTLNGSDTIELPEYWRKLVYPESITVNLTPIGYYQELYVEENVQWGTRIKVKNNSGTKTHCHYTVFAKRVTQDELQVEYKGLTPDDYPGDNSEYALGGWDYARHKGEPKTPNL